jgi:GAF domain-containing protein
MESLTEQLAQMAHDLNGDADVAETVEQIAEYAKETLSCDHAGILLVLGNRRIETAAATDPIVEKADQLQMECGEGPCLESIWTHDTYVVHDAETDERWPVYGPLVAGLGLHSILGLRLHSADQTLGALNLFSVERREFTEEDVSMAHVFAQHASVALAAARKEEGLRVAIDARHLIGQAQGILMERFGLDADKAFLVLRRYSQDNNVKLRAVAERLIETRSLPPTITVDRGRGVSRSRRLADSP